MGRFPYLGAHHIGLQWSRFFHREYLEPGRWFHPQVIRRFLGIIQTERRIDKSEELFEIGFANPLNALTGILQHDRILRLGA